jgi:hypothetical protein
MIAWSWKCTPSIALAVWFPPLYSGSVGEVTEPWQKR